MRCVPIDARFEESLKPARAGLNPFLLFVKESQTKTSEELGTVITFIEKESQKKKSKLDRLAILQIGVRELVSIRIVLFYCLADLFDWF